jgi:hypothetical protein
MTTNRAITAPTSPEKLSEYDLAYAAGLIDGEGCIGIYPNSHNGNYQLRLSVEMTDKIGLSVLWRLFGGKWYYKKAVAPRKARYVWMTFNREAASACKALRPYLRVKAKQVDNVLTADWLSFYKRKMSLEQQAIRKQVWLKNKELNSRGYYK